MTAPDIQPTLSPTRAELLEFRRRSFRMFVALCLLLLCVGILLRVAGLPRPFGLLMGAWIAAVHYFQPVYPGATQASAGVRLVRSLVLGTVFGALAQWWVLGD